MLANQNEEEALTVPKIISDQKFSDFLKQVPLTIFGLQSQKVPLIILIIIGFILSAIVIIIPLLVDIYAIAVIVPILALPTIIIIFDITSSCILQDRQCCMNIFLKLQTWIKYLSLAIYGFLWSNHFYLCSNSQSYIPCIIGSVIGVLTSINSISFEGVKEFTSSSPNFTNYGIQETRGIRLLIIVPTFLAEFIIRAAYGFERCDNLLENTEGLLVFNSFIWIAWIFGWVSSIGNTYKYIINTINHYILGEEKIQNGVILLVSFILNLVPWGLACIPVEGNIYRLYILVIGATITSWIIAILNIFISQKLIKDHYLRFFIISAIELVNLGVLLILLGLITFKWQTFLVVTAINIFFFVLLQIIKEFTLARNHFGLRLCTTELVYPPFFNLVQRVLLRFTSSICIVWASLGLVLIQQQTRSYLVWNMNTITYFLIPVLVYRSFKRCLTESRSFSLHLSIIISLILIAIDLQSTKYSSIFVILLMPPFPQNFYLAFLSPFLIPQKALRKNQCLYRFLYYFTTIIGLFLYIITLWTLQWTMIFGMPMFWPVIPSSMSISSNATAEQSLYRKILQNLDSSIFRGLKKGMYLLRIDKYIVYIQVKLECYGLLQIVQFRGMEAQEVTSCHSREGQTLDRIVQETWNENSSKIFTLDPYKTVLWPICKKQIQVPVQNEIKLTGIIQTADYLQLFKSATIKSLIHFFQKFQLSIQMKNQGQVILSQLSAITKKQPVQSVFPFQFAKQYSKQYLIQLQSNKKKLPPIIKQKKKDAILGDYLDLLGGGNDSLVKRQTAQPVTNLGEQQNSQHALNQQPSIPYSKIQQINLSIIMTFYSYMVARHDYFNTTRIVSLIRQEKDTLPQIQFKDKEKFASKVISAAMKISIDKYLLGQTQITKQDFENYEKNQFLGVIQSEGFAEATRTGKEDIWTVSVSKKQLNIKRLAKADINLYLFGLDGWLVKSVWNNLRFQLLYAANDDDERYSIQTHPNLLRNLWVEACEEPFGYAGFYSGSISNI